ncbi:MULTISPECIES: replicative DNA helicase [Rhizobium/Agrobacterium group]|mgnify:FL=1|jgi:replicative DNA helicase|uniref:replicative DNA helicase n=1 Tax=Rhizobium/Agrobacterium group TaxID=227290 RepID=UPI0007131A83|nr:MULTISPECIES: replicative DNA helicase [Rhizobium/Agrobacterium group]KQQ74186.1 replicative DNA helicase [Rhizobium sp. Leaf321]MBD8649937.1 replicative DNA helicase [Rhizobium sp. CFBP 13726]MBD8663651.1 replicative DNA helicase [Rhizobium sp. CFBP 8752]MBP2460630.1 replicative DNA helicase [Rhizobium sp. PvP014]MBP2528027.1 replicative DNA helicase [Rhizobium sp. PvP099]
MNEVARNIASLSNKDAAPHYREAPNNIEAEQALLGAILVNNDAYYRVSDFLKPTHLYEPLHRKIFEVAGDIIRMGKTANPVTIKNFVPADEKVGDMTVAQYLARLAAEAVSIINAEDYGRAIYDLALRRALITIGEDVVNIAYDAPLDMPPQSQIEDTERRLFELAENGRYDGGFQSFNDAVALAIDMAGQAFERDGHLSGISTGIMSLDGKMGGLQRSDLIVLAGRPGMGKTSLATNIAYNIAASYEPEVQPDGSMKAKNGGVVGFYSLEMSSEQLATRIISEQTEVSSSKIRRGDITEADFEKLVACSQMMQKVPLFIDQTGGISIAQLSARARRLKRQRGLDCLVVDYIQLMTGSGKSGENRVQEITQITTGLKALGKELNVPIIALSQLSRQVESREDKRPQLSDLRESGSIEQDADVVLFVFREEYYVKNSEPRDMADPKYPEWEQLMDKVKGTADVIIAKQRHGPTGTVKLAFQAEFTRFADLAEPSFTQYEEH